jgi:glucose/arabinose dehydrogenase
MRYGRVASAKLPHRGRQRRLQIERLEHRVLLAGDTYLVNFQLDEATPVTRYLVDSGQVFGPRGGGLSYGWSSIHTDQARERSILPDQRYDTLIHFHVGQRWDFQLPNGTYEVTVAVGDPANNDGVHTINVEGVNFWNAVPDTNDSLTMTKQVSVNDGLLTINQGAAAERATRINFVHIVGLPSGPNNAPAAPTITEPATNGQLVHPADVHMEAIGFSDPDGNTHKSTDWEIWTVGPGAQPVWQTLGITGVERLHTHMGDGIFINSRAGQTSLAANTDHELRVRFRDDAGSVSTYSVRQFRTSAASVTFPLELRDVATTPAVTWRTVPGVNVELPAGGDISSLRLESADGQLLLQLSGTEAAGNLVNNPASLADHVPVRIIIESASNALNLGETNLTFNNETGDPITIYLPAIDLDPGQRLDLWVGFDGATYYGTAAQTEPDFTNLARMSEATPSNNPFVVLQPGFVIEEVGNDYRLPVNIAFVPNPGPDLDDPLYYVTELYGSIQVVTRDGTKHEFATGLLDYNPTGPISGSGEQGLTGIAVERDAANPEIYHLYIGLLADNGLPPGGAVHYPKVERLDSQAGGLAMASRSVLLNMQPETQGQSHQISNVSIGPDGKLYVHNGDGFNTGTAQNLNQFRGKILRMNLDGSAPSDNPFYNAADGINARDYVFAYGVRNPFGGAWRASDGMHYEVENGPSVDRLAQIVEGRNYLWDGSDQSMTNFAIYNWNPAHAPVNMTFVQQETFAGSQFPASLRDHLYVSESGPTYANGPQSRGKRIVEFVLDENGDLVSGPTTFVEYRGTGRGSVVGLGAGPDGLYFTEMYEDSGGNGPTAPGARIFRVRYVNPIVGDYSIDGVVGEGDHGAWRESYGSNLLLAADGNKNGVVDTADYVIWRKAFGSGQAAGAQIAAAPPASAVIASPANDRPSSASAKEQQSNNDFVFLDQTVSESRPSFRPVARSLRLADSSAGRDAALLTLLERDRPATSWLDNSLASGGVDSDDSDDDDSLRFVDDVFTELALL